MKARSKAIYLRVCSVTIKSSESLEAMLLLVVLITTSNQTVIFLCNTN